MVLLRIPDLVMEINQFHTDHSNNGPQFVYLSINLTLANGLIHKRNGTRIWAGIFAGIDILVISIFLGWLSFTALHATSFSFGYERYNYKISMSQSQLIAFYGLLIAFNAINLYILQRPSTKALFSPQLASSLESIPQESP
jgi:hypothetical protein